MLTHDAFPGVGFTHLGPITDPKLAELRAWQISRFMRDEVHGPLYEDEFGLRNIDPDPPSGTKGDIPWRVEQMPLHNTIQPDGTHREYIIAVRLTEDGKVSPEDSAIQGLLVVTKPTGICTADRHRPSYYAEIDVARAMRGRKMGPYMISLLQQTHPQDPSIGLEVYQHNRASIAFHERLGFEIDQAAPPERSELYDGLWIPMHTTGETLFRNLADILRESGLQ